MPDVGSDAWIANLAARAAALDVDPAARIVVQQEIVDTAARWHVVVAGGRAEVVAGAHPSPDVSFAQDLDTASGIAGGRLSAQQAFMDGRLRVRGAMDRLVEAAGALATLGS